MRALTVTVVSVQVECIGWQPSRGEESELVNDGSERGLCSVWRTQDNVVHKSIA